MTLVETLEPLGITTLNSDLFNKTTLKFNSCIKSGCKNMTFTETTGSYIALTNPNGWSASRKSFIVTSINIIAGTVTLTTSIAHNIINGQSIIVQGITGTTGSFNGTFIVTAVGATTINYTLGVSTQGPFAQTTGLVISNLTIPATSNYLPDYTVSTTKAILAIYDEDFNSEDDLLTSTSLLGFLDITALGFPNTNDDFDIEIASTELMTEDNYPDGLYTLVYMVFDTINPLAFKYYLKSTNKTFYCNSKCCVSKMAAALAIENPSCNCEDVKLEEVILANAIYLSLEASAEAGQRDNFKKQLKLMNKICGTDDGSCSCGCS